MSDANNDPSANTQAFQAWVDQRPAAPVEKRSRAGMFIAIAAVAALVVIGLAAWIVLG